MPWKLIIMAMSAVGYVAMCLLVAEGERELHERDYYQ